MASNKRISASLHITNQQILEISITLSLSLVSSGLRIRSKATLNLDYSWYHILWINMMRGLSNWMSSVPFLMITIVRSCIKTKISVATWTHLMIWSTTMLMHLRVTAFSYWLNIFTLLHKTWIFCRAWPFWLHKRLRIGISLNT